MNIYLIAGPPGVGKSTNARVFIPPDISIIDQDLAAYQYKKEGFGNYQDIASMSTHSALDEFALTRLYAVPFVRNQASIKELEKADYQREGIMRRSAIKDGQVLDQALYAYIADA